MTELPTPSKAIERLNEWSAEAKDILNEEDKAQAAEKTNALKSRLREEMILILDPKFKQKYENDPEYQTIVEFFLSIMNRSPAEIQSDNYQKFLFGVQDFSIIAVNRLNLMKEGKGVLVF